MADYKFDGNVLKDSHNNKIAEVIGTIIKQEFKDKPLRSLVDQVMTRL